MLVPIPFCLVLSHSSCLPLFPPFLRRCCFEEYKAGTPLPKAEAGTGEYFPRPLLPTLTCQLCAFLI